VVRETSLRRVQEALGHAHLKTSSIYIQPAPEVMKKELQEHLLQQGGPRMNKLVVEAVRLLISLMGVGSEAVRILNGVAKDCCLILLGGLLATAGGVLTTLLTYKPQSRGQERQWRKDRMERRFEPLRLYVRDTLNLMQLRHHAEDPDLKKAYHTQRRDRTVRRSKVQSSLAASGDERLEELFKRLDQNFNAWLNAFDKKRWRQDGRGRTANKGLDWPCGRNPQENGRTPRT